MTAVEAYQRLLESRCIPTYASEFSSETNTRDVMRRINNFYHKSVKERNAIVDALQNTKHSPEPELSLCSDEQQKAYNTSKERKRYLEIWFSNRAAFYETLLDRKKTDIIPNSERKFWTHFSYLVNHPRSMWTSNMHTRQVPLGEELPDPQHVVDAKDIEPPIDRCISNYIVQRRIHRFPLSENLENIEVLNGNHTMNDDVGIMVAIWGSD